jgi:hypothetical protein
MLLPVLAIALSAVVLLTATAFVREPARVRRLTVVNRGDTAITVTVGPADDNGVQLLGTIEPASTHSLRDLPDQGSMWVFSFSYAGVDLGRTRVARAALARDGWRLVIPDVSRTDLSRPDLNRTGLNRTGR